MVHYKGAAETSAANLQETAKDAGLTAFAAAVAEEVAAGALVCTYPPGESKTAIGLGAAAAAPAASSAGAAEPDIRVFQSAFAQHVAASEGGAGASPDVVEQIGNACEDLDGLLQKVGGQLGRDPRVLTPHPIHYLPPLPSWPT